MLKAKITEWLGMWKVSNKSSYLSTGLWRTKNLYAQPNPIILLFIKGTRGAKQRWTKQIKEHNGEKLNYDKDDCEREYLEYVKQIAN